ncbi:hypothetical protein BELL_0831g00010 [Botrytis elliptica]|uniref:Uncharacterized protein n=1 Tax=Botrytis elliptica TaxID=278938 RepID=A0A4Z1J3Y5_9HELO|nr:hypothetical protein BELL_0831g00010 [Botrytis elliptica]
MDRQGDGSAKRSRNRDSRETQREATGYVDSLSLSPSLPLPLSHPHTHPN